MITRAEKIKQNQDTKKALDAIAPIKKITIKASDYFYQRTFDFEIAGEVKRCFIRIPNNMDVILEVDEDLSIPKRYKRFLTMLPELEIYKKYFVK